MHHDRCQDERDALIGAVRAIVQKTCTEIGPDEREDFMAVVEQAANDAYFDVLELYREQAAAMLPSGMFHPDALSFEQRGLTRRARRVRA